MLDPQEVCVAEEHTTPCPRCVAGDCYEPGSNRHNPYLTKDIYDRAVRYYRVLQSVAQTLPASNELRAIGDALTTPPWPGAASEDEGSGIGDPIHWMVERNMSLAREAGLCRLSMMEALARGEAGDVEGMMAVLRSALMRPSS